jgi:hypothetical protein
VVISTSVVVTSAVTTETVTEFTVGADVSTRSLLQSAAAAAMLVWVLMVSAMLGSAIVVVRAWAVAASATATVKAVVTEDEPERVALTMKPVTVIWVSKPVTVTR